ncbi:hypothetical protein Tco_1428355 [Tanacetum coccineum]
MQSPTKLQSQFQEIYMQEFWVTASRHHSLLRFKMNGKSHTVNVDNFRDMLQIYPKLPELGRTGEIKVLSDVNVNHMHQPWRSFAAIINKCLSGKTTALENLVYQVEKKNSKKNNDMYYPRFIKVIVDYFMAKDRSIPRRNKMSWHTARNDPMFTTIRVISKHQDTHIYGAILPHHLTNQAMLESKAYKTYHDYATGEKIPKPKYVKNKADLVSSPKKKSAQASKGKRIKTSTKVAKPVKKKQPVTTSKEKGLNVLSEVALSEAEQIKLATKRSLIQTHNSHASCSVTRKMIDETESDNDDDDLFHPRLSTFDEKEIKDEEDKEEEWSDDEAYNDETQGVNVEGEELDEEETNEEDEVNELYRDVNVNLEGRDTEMTDAPQTNIQGTQVTEDTYVIITTATPEVQQQCSSVSSGFISNMLNPNPDTGIDSILNLKTASTSLVDVPVSTNVEMPPSSITPLPPPPFIQPQQQTPIPTPIIVPSTSLQNLLTFGSLFKFKDKVKALEDDFSEFKQTNQFASVVTLIPDIDKMNEAVKTAMQLQSDRIRDEAQAENEDFINTLDENMRKIIKKQVKEQVKEQVSKILPKIEKFINDQLEAEVLTRSSNQAETSHAVAANLSELELKKILIDKMENNKSIDRSIQQKTLYKALVNAYETDKDILETYRDTIAFKRRRDDEDEDEEPFTGSNWGSKRRRAGKEPESTIAPKEKTSKSSGKSKEGSKSHHTSTGNSAQAEEPIHAFEDLEEPTHQEFDTGFTEDQPVDETTQHPDWFQKPTKPPTPDRDWNKTLPAKHGPVQHWISTLARNEDPRESFNEQMDTPLDFSTFMMNRLKVDTLTPELLAGPTYELMKGSCKSLVELEYFLEEVCKATTDQLDWNNPEGQQYPHDLRKPLPLIPNSRGRRVIPFDHFINNDLAYLSGGVSSRTYATSVTKTKAADYGHIKWIEDFVPNSMWSQVPSVYDKHALWGISHWGRKRQQFYGFAVNRESARDVYSKHRILAVTKLKIVEWHNYKHLDWITVRRNDDKLYTFKEGDYNRLRLQDIEDMLLLLVQGKLTNLNVEERLALGVSLRMFTRSVVLRRRVEDLQLGVKSYQKKLNLTRPDTYRSDLKQKTPYTAYSNPKGFIYQNKDKKNRLMRIDELYKFSDGTLNDVLSALDDILKRIWMEYLPQTVWRNVDRERAGAMI